MVKHFLAHFFCLGGGLGYTQLTQDTNVRGLIQNFIRINEF
jgi:hypothetical protein